MPMPFPFQHPVRFTLCLSFLLAALTGGCGGGGDDTAQEAAGSTPAAQADKSMATPSDAQWLGRMSAAAGAAKYYFNTWKTVSAWCQPTPHDDNARCGKLYAGRNYFYCQVQRGAHPYRDSGYSNNWYAYTDLDEPAGAKGWVSAVHFTVGGDWEPIPGLPVCPEPSPPQQPAPQNYVLPIPAGAMDATASNLYVSHGGDNYWAIDLMVRDETPVYSVTSGVMAGFDRSASCGNGLTIQGDDGLFYLYCHGSRYNGLQVGDRVRAGQVILYSGHSGGVKPHLHFEIRQGHNENWDRLDKYCAQRFLRNIRDGNPVSPTNFPARGDCRASTG